MPTRKAAGNDESTVIMVLFLLVLAHLQPWAEKLS
jgi:hypothetical protein